MSVKSIGIRTDYSNAEHLRKWLSSHKVINQSLSFIKEEHNLIIPLTISEEEAKNLFSSYQNKVHLEVGVFQFEKKEHTPKNLFESVKNTIPSSLHKYIPKAYDMIGDIVIVDIPNELIEYKTIIGNSLYSLFPSINTVYRKASSVSGKYRIRQLEFLSGEQNCDTIHLEYGIKIAVNICETYFSPRLGDEHQRVANSVKEEECIVDLFTGVGSFPLHIAKKHDANIYAIDINENAIVCLEKSISINKLKGVIHPIQGDCREVVDKIPKADKVIMNLPSKSLDYIDVACKIMKPKGILYFYYFSSEESPKEEMIERLEIELQKSNWKIREVLDYRRVRDSAPREIQACLELVVTPLF
jgi:tRNA (guanine37-N1)-methyltransferase